MWDLNTGEIIWRLGGKELEISAIALSRSGERIATLGPSGCTEYERSNGEEHIHHELPTGACISYGDSERLTICSSILGLVQLWHAGNLAGAQVIGTTAKGIEAGSFSATAQAVMIQPTGEPTMEVLRPDGQLVQRLGVSGPVAACLSGDGTLAATATNRNVQLWKNGDVLNHVDASNVHHLALSPTGTQLAILNDSYAVTVLSIPDLRSSPPPSPQFPPEALCADSQGEHIVVATRGGGLFAWSTASGQGDRLAHSTDHPRAILAKPTAQDEVVTRVAEGTIGSVSVRQPSRREVYGNLFGEPELLCFSADGERWAYVDNNLIHIHRRGSAQPMQIPSPGAHQVENLKLSPNGDALAVAWLGGVIGTLHIGSSNQEDFQFLRRTGPAVHALAYSPNDARLAIADVTGTLEVWNTKRGEIAWTTRMGSVSSLCWSHDGTYLAAGEYYGDINVFHGNSQLHSWHSVAGEVLSLCYSHDGAILYSGYKNTTVLAWKIDQS